MYPTESRLQPDVKRAKCPNDTLFAGVSLIFAVVMCTANIPIKFRVSPIKIPGFEVVMHGLHGKNHYS